MRKFASILPIVLLLFSCEKEIELDVPTPEQQLVVQGHIEQNLPPYVILSRSTPFFESTSLDQLTGTLVHDARIFVNDGSEVIEMEELYYDSLPDRAFEFINDELANLFAFDVAELRGKGISFYSTREMLGRIGRSYALSIFADGKFLNAVTTIPEPSPLDSLWFEPHPDPEQDTLVTLYARYVDEPNRRNFIRYMTQRNRELMFPPLFQSVFDDFRIFNINGKSIDFALERGQSQFAERDFDTYSYFTKGDTIIVKWCAIDEAHFDFWSTMEFDRNQTGNPFGRPTRIKSNINGGLGIWGGYGASYELIISEED